MINGATIQQKIPKLDNLPSIPTNILVELLPAIPTNIQVVLEAVESELEIPTGITLTEVLPIGWDYTLFQAGVNTNDTLVGVVVENGLLDMTSVPDESDFEVKINGTPITPTGLTMSTTYIRLTIQQFAYGDVLTVSYTPGINPAKGQDGALLSSLTDQALDNILPEPSFNYLLDDYPGAAAAYSLRKLRTGVVQGIMVRRDSDDQLVDVQLYDDPSKSIDLDSIIAGGGAGTLGEWVGSASAFVFNWYDQSGNGNHGSNLTEAEQPRIINAGVLEAKGVVFDGVDDGLSATSTSSLQIIGGMSAYSVLNINTLTFTVSQTVFIKRVSDNDREYEYRFSSVETRYLDDNNSIVDTDENVINTDYLQSFDRVANTSVQMYKNGTNGGVQSLSGVNAVTSAPLEIGARVIGNQNFINGGVKEIILWGSDQSANRTAIETNINDFYSIYVVTAEVDAQLIQADTDNVSDTIIEINGVRSSASDTAVANLISRNNTVITN